MSKKVVLITGASSGIGFDAGRSLAEAGHSVHGTTRSPETDGYGFTMHTCDVQNRQAVIDLIETIVDKEGRLDVLINNAGVGLRGAVEESDPDKVRDLFETNFFGVLNCVQAALPPMRSQKDGLIINISSIVGLLGIPYNGVYSASKFALEGLSQALRLEVAQFGVRVALINPGFIVTKFADSATYADSMPAYSSLRERAQERIKSGLEKGPDPGIVTEAIEEIIAGKVEETNYIVGQDASDMLDKWNEMGPEGFADHMRKTYGL